jgi:Tol biopolymer transport system component
MDHTLPDAIVRRYRVEGEVGSGGGGVVYKATDTRLNRAVAIKTIHDGRVRHGGDSLRTEALAAASIDHPYICKVYELIEDGADFYLVMEFVEGETLSTILRRGRPPLSQTVQLANEIVEGLAAAHARGLVHRDVKPSNVIVTPDGHVKLLDFGIAGEDVIATPSDRTRTSPSDRDPTAGTPQYMSPEQAAGHPVTFKADLFSVGVVLFECLTAQLPFTGSSAYDYVRHLLTDAPRRLDRLAPGAPAALVDLVERCLEKNPADRPESAAAVLAELRHIAGALTGVPGAFHTAGAVRVKRRWQWTAVAIAVGGIAIAVWQWQASIPAADPLRRSRPIVMWSSEETGSRLSADGKWLSFVSTRDGAAQLFVQPVTGTEARPVTLSAGRIESHTWSPSGDQIAVALGRPGNNVLQIVPAFFGGAAVQSITLDPALNEMRLLRWIGRRIFLQVISDTRRFLAVADLDAGTIQDASASWSLEGSLIHLDVHPDGRRVVLVMKSGEQEDLWETDLSGGSLRRLTNDAFFERFPIWNGSGEAIIFQTNRGGQSDLWELEPRSGRLRPLTSSQSEETPDGTSADDSILSFQLSSDEAKLWRIDPATRASTQLASDALSDFAPGTSADGRTLVFQRSEPSPSQGYRILDSQLFVAGLGGTGLSAPPRAVAAGFAGLLSPDGSRLAFMQDGEKPGQTRLSVVDLATDEKASVSATGRLSVFRHYPVDWNEELMAWHPEKGLLYFVDHRAVPSIAAYDAASKRVAPPIFTGAPNGFIRDLFVSQDGERLTFLTIGGGKFGVQVHDLASGQQREIATLAGSFTSAYCRGWLPDGRIVIVKSLEVNPDFTATMAVLLLKPDGTTTTAGPIANALLSTARMDPAHGMLYVTRVEGGVHNVYGFAIATGRLTQVTDNALPGVSFSGVRPAGRALITVRNQRARDIWLIETQGNTVTGRRD